MEEDEEGRYSAWLFEPAPACESSERWTAREKRRQKLGSRGTAAMAREDGVRSEEEEVGSVGGVGVEEGSEGLPVVVASPYVEECRVWRAGRCEGRA